MPGYSRSLVDLRANFLHHSHQTEVFLVEYHKTFRFRIGAVVPRPSPKPLSSGARYFLGAAGLLLLLVNLHQFRKEFLLSRYAVSRQAQVINTYWNSGKGGPRYRARYQYVLPSGARYIGKGRISRYNYRGIKHGHP